MRLVYPARTGFFAFKTTPAMRSSIYDSDGFYSAWILHTTTRQFIGGSMRFKSAGWLILAFCAAAALPVFLSAQQQSQAAQQSPQSDWQSPQVPAGTRFLVGLVDEINTKTAKAHQQFTVRTLETLDAPDGHVIPSGTLIRGHISRVEPAGTVGHARIWLTFDDIQSHGAWRPLVADVTELPGEHSVKPGEIKEGEIQARTSPTEKNIEAAAAGAAVGAAPGAAKKDTKAAAIGAATGALTAYLTSSGLGQDLDLGKGTKLELELQRPLYLAQR
jgi:hypothetical protein